MTYLEETPEARLRRVSGMKRNQKFRPPRTSNSMQLGGDNDIRKKFKVEVSLKKVQYEMSYICAHICAVSVHLF